MLNPMFAIGNPPEYSSLIGPPGKVRGQLEKVKTEQVLVMPLEGVNAREAQLLEQTLRSVLSFFGQALIEQNSQTLKALVDAMVPKVPPEPILLREAAMIARSRKAVLDDAKWLSAAMLADVAGLSSANPSSQPNKWKREGRIFAIDHNGLDYYPTYGLDSTANWRPIKALKSVLNVFVDNKDGWGLAYWFHSANSFLGGRRPQDVLATEPEQVIAAAIDEMQSAVHA